MIGRPGARWLVAAVALSIAPSAGSSGARGIPVASELVAIDLAGTQTNLTQDPAWDLAPSVSRDGRIAFLRMRDGTSDLYVMNFDGSTVRRLTTSPFDDHEVVWNDSGISQPAWSLRGNLIAFDTQNATVPPGCFRDCVSWQVYVAGADGSGLREMTPDGQSPAWSPDGRRLAYVSGFDPFNRETTKLTITRLDASSSVDVPALNPLPRSGPAWSPDGKELAFQARPREGRVPTRIYLVRADGRGRRRLSLGRSPIWSPDSRRLAFIDNYRLITIGRDGRGRRQLSRSGELVLSASWSPKTNALAFVSVSSLGDGGGAPADLRIETVHADGKRFRVLAREPAGSFAWSGPVWMPDGKRILVAVG